MCLLCDVFVDLRVDAPAGILRGVSGVLVLSQPLFVSLIEHQLEGNFVYVHWTWLILMLVAASLCFWLKSVSKEAVLFEPV